MSWAFPSVTQPDSTGLVVVPTSLTVVYTGAIQIDQILIVNTSDTERTILVTDTAGNQVIPTMPVPAHSVLPPIEALFLTDMVGLKWQASGAGLVGQIRKWNL